MLCSWVNILSASLCGLILDSDASKLVLSYDATWWVPNPTNTSQADAFKAPLRLGMLSAVSLN